jgi:predicted AAA+ superfamily ATPase
MSFDEFLEAMGEGQLIELKNKAAIAKPLDDVFHKKLIDYLRIYYIIGGMPEAVKEYMASKNIISCQKKLTGLIETLRDDFAKYKKRFPTQRLREVFDSIALQAGGKFEYSNIDSHSSHKSLKDALDLIVEAGLAYKIYHTSANGLPLGAQIKTNKFKVILLDTGIHQKILGLNMAEIIAAQDINAINKGNIAEVFTGLEIIKNSPCDTKGQLYYWHKEKRASNAEVDYIIQHNERIIPIEVKSGIRGKMQSMRLFIAEHNTKKGIRLSLENFADYEDIDVYPIYAVSSILKIS